MKLCATGRRVSAHVIRLVQAVQACTATGAQSAHSGVRRSSSTLGTALAFSLLPLAHQASFMCRETAKPIAAAVDTESSVGGLRGRLLLPTGHVFPRLPPIAIQQATAKRSRRLNLGCTRLTNHATISSSRCDWPRLACSSTKKPQIPRFFERAQFICSERTDRCHRERLPLVGRLFASEEWLVRLSPRHTAVSRHSSSHFHGREKPGKTRKLEHVERRMLRPSTRPLKTCTRSQNTQTAHNT